MNRNAPRPRPASRTAAPTSISFRLAAAESLALDERARALKISPHELARTWVIETLNRGGAPAAAPPQADDGELLARLTIIFHHVVETRQDIALGVEGLLTRGGRLTDADARQWVTENFPAACFPSP